MADRHLLRRLGWPAVSPATGDRILVGLCAAVWLALVGAGVAAVVALADLGRGFHASTPNRHTSSVLYAVIIVSALIILAAIPVLLGARRTLEPARSPGMPTAVAPAQPIRPGHLPPTGFQRAPTGRAATSGAGEASAGAAVDRIWLRGTVTLIATMGLALVAVATATYLMAVGHDRASWTGYGIAGLITLVMPLLLWRHLRQLRRTLASP
ncbi:DUF2561 family protein [Mycobacterium sp.]|uniref:DUF2561 family protein n=1 Tax=Mycobacterium sp. TaxID=1785 RepID=UPI0031D8C820